MNRKQAKHIGEQFGQCMVMLGIALLIFPFFKALAYVATIYNSLFY